MVKKNVLAFLIMIGLLALFGAASCGDTTSESGPGTENACGGDCPEGTMCNEEFGVCEAVCIPECGDGFRCDNGECVKDIVECDPPCADGEECRDGICFAPTPDGDDDAATIDCDPACDDDEVCVNGFCVEPPPDGDEDEDTTDPNACVPECGDGFRCVGGECIEITEDCDPPCGEGYYCSNGECVEDTPVEDGDWDIEVDTEIDTTHTPCDNNAALDYPVISVSPSQADFGAVPLGQVREIRLDICNGGGADLHISSFQFSPGTSPEFIKLHGELPRTIEPGYAEPIFLLYQPMDGQEDSGELHILSDDPNAQRLEIPMRSRIKPTPRIELRPHVIQFPGAMPGVPLERIAEVHNTGTAASSIMAIDIAGGSGSPFEVVEVVKSGEGAPSEGPWQLGINEYLTVTVQMVLAEETGEAEDEMIVRWTTDSGEQVSRATLTTHGNAICAVPVAEPDQTVSPLDTVYVDGSSSYDENGTILGYKWEWETKPDEAFRAIIQDADGNNIQGQWVQDPHAQFYAELAGTYVLKLTVQDSDAGCTELNYDTVTIVAVPDETIHVQLMWSAQSNDHDLHFIRPGGFHSRNCGDGNITDCHWCNCDTDHGTNPDCPPRGCPGPSDAPDWGVVGDRSDDPSLDIDDIPGRGPENINLSLPELGDYLVTVENYSGSNNVGVTVRVWLFGVLMGTFRYGPPYTPTGFGSNNHWNVCWIRVHNPTDIEIIPIGTIEPSARRLGETMFEK